MSTEHWGEMPHKEGGNAQLPDVTADIQRAMNKFFLNSLEQEDRNIATEQKIRFFFFILTQ